MKRSRASLADTPTGRPRHQTPRWVKNTFAVLGMLLVGRTVQGLWLPSLTPEQAALIDMDARYARWKVSPEGAGFERLRVIAARVKADRRSIDRCVTDLYDDPAKPVDAAKVQAALRDARRLIRRHHATLTEMRQSVREPFALPPLRSMSETMPYLSDFRTLARLNALEAQLKRRDGDWDVSADILVSGMEQGKRLMSGGIAVGRLSGYATQAIATRPLGHALPYLKPGTYRRLLPRIQDVAQTPPVARVYAEEKWFGQRTLLGLWGDRRGGKETQFDPGFALTSLIWPRRQVFHAHTTYMEACEQFGHTPYAPNEKTPVPPTDFTNQLMLPLLDNLRFKDVQTRAQNALVLQSVALYAFHHKQGRFPDSLRELASCGMPVAADPFRQNRPLCYRLDGHGSFFLYSVGPDGQDDGGSPILRERDGRGRPLSGIDARVVEQDSRGDMVEGINF